MNTKIYIIFLIIQFSTLTSARSQTKSILEGLKANTEYIQLIEKEEQLYLKQDSIVKIIESKKVNFQNSTLSENEKVEATNEILNLESSLFDIRSELGILTSKTSSIEQEYIIANMDAANNNNTAADSDENITNILSFSKIKSELTKTELSFLSRIKEAELDIKMGFDTINFYTQELDTIKKHYTLTGDKLIGDSLQKEFNSIISQIKNIDYSATELWEQVNSTELDFYNRMLDKFMAPSNVIEKLNETSRNVRSEESDLNNNFLSSNISKYTRQKLLTLEYKKALAKLLNLDAVLKDIEASEKNIIVDAYDINKIDFVLQDFVLYQNIERIAAKAHSADNPIGELDIPTKGELHKVELGTYTKPLTSYTSFYRVSPIVSQKLQNGKTRYWAGSFPTLKEAEDASKQLNRIGMKTKVASWINGKNLADSTLNLGVFEVKFTNFTTIVKNKLAANCPNMDVENGTDEEGGIFYKIGPFTTKTEARKIADLIGNDSEIIMLNIPN